MVYKSLTQAKLKKKKKKEKKGIGKDKHAMTKKIPTWYSGVEQQVGG